MPGGTYTKVAREGKVVTNYIILSVLRGGVGASTLIENPQWMAHDPRDVAKMAGFLPNGLIEVTVATDKGTFRYVPMPRETLREHAKRVLREWLTFPRSAA